MKDEGSQTHPQIHHAPLPPGLYLVATPIGNLRDITYRAVEVLHSAAVVACEDTRISGRLLKHYGIKTRMEPYHEHNAAKKRPQLVARAAKEPVALISDAGTPLISDPGYKLVREAVAAGVRVESLPGPSSVLAALCVSGLPTNRFLFEGFLPTKEQQALAVLEPLKLLEATLVFFESAKRVAATLARMEAVLGPEREAAVMRELTKLYEETRRGTLAKLAAHYAQAGEPRGEVVIVIGPAPQQQEMTPEALDELILSGLKGNTLKSAVQEICEAHGLPHRQVYARALELKNREG